MEDEKKLQLLEADLKHIAKPLLTAQAKAALRQQLLANIRQYGSEQSEALIPSSWRRLVEKIMVVGQQVPTVEMKRALKLSLFELIEARDNVVLPSWSLTGKHRFKMALSGVLLVTFVSSALLVSPFQVPVTYARSTYLSEVEGDVFVVRDSEFIKAEPFFALQEGDAVVTHDESFASIHFFDDSLGRLSENTNLEIEKLYTEPFNPVVTQIGLFLEEGRIWAKVVNLIDAESRFTVDTPKVQANVAKKAAFDLATHEGSTTVRVFDNVVDVTSLRSADPHPKTIVAGYQAEISRNTNVQIAVLPEADVAASSQDWTVANLTLDEAYSHSLVQEKEDMIEAGDAAEMDSMTPNSIQGEASLMNDEIEQEKIAFTEAYSELKKGETLLIRGVHQDGVVALGNFYTGTIKIINRLPAFKQKDPFNADLLRSFMQEKVSLQLKDLASFLPGERLYAAKEILQQVEVLLAESEVERAQVRLAQAEGKLFEIQELIKDGKMSLATTMVRSYNKQMEQFILRINKENFDELQDKLTALVTQQVQQIKVLTAIEQSLKGEGQSVLRQEVRKVIQITLRKLIIALKQFSGTVPKQLVYQLKDIFDSYVLQDATNQDVFLEALDKLLNDEQQLLFIQPDTTEELGVLMIVTQEGSSDAIDAPELGTSVDN